MSGGERRTPAVSRSVERSAGGTRPPIRSTSAKAVRRRAVPPVAAEPSPMPRPVPGIPENEAGRPRRTRAAPPRPGCAARPERWRRARARLQSPRPRERSWRLPRAAWRSVEADARPRPRASRGWRPRRRAGPRGRPDGEGATRGGGGLPGHVDPAPGCARRSADRTSGARPDRLRGGRARRPASTRSTASSGPVQRGVHLLGDLTHGAKRLCGDLVERRGRPGGRDRPERAGGDGQRHHRDSSSMSGSRECHDPSRPRTGSSRDTRPGPPACAPCRFRSALTGETEGERGKDGGSAAPRLDG